MVSEQVFLEASATSLLHPHVRTTPTVMRRI
jgi:hypothetical protein